MEDIGVKLYELIKAEFDRSRAEDPFLRSVAVKLEKDTATMRDVSLYAQQLGFRLKMAILHNVSAGVLPNGQMYYNIAEKILSPTLHDNYDLVGEIAAQVQEQLDKAADIHIRPQQAPFNEERLKTVLNAASEPGLDEETMLRRLSGPAETMTADFADDYMKANAGFRDSAGVETYIVRIDHSGCCEWCARLAGRYEYSSAPRDIFRRHDNCTCTVEYISGGQKQNVHTKDLSPFTEADQKRIDELTARKGTTRLTAYEAKDIEQRVRGELLSRNKVDIADNAKSAENVSAVELWETENYKNSTEKGLLILPDGKTKDFGGIEHHVTGKEEDIKLMDGATFTHNHPTDNTFSQNDIVTGLVKGNLKEMRAVTSTGDVHILVNNGATEQQRKKFNVDYQQRRMKAANTADAKIRRGEKINKDEYVKSRLETFMSEHAEEYNLSYTKRRINVSPKNIVVQGGFDESKIISDDLKAEISRCIEKVQGEYNVKVDIFSFEEIEGIKVPFQFVPVDDNGKYKSKFVINKGFNWEENLDKLNERIYNNNYSKGILASQNTEDLIYHEMAHFMTFQECDDFYDYVSLERSVRRDFKAGVSMYSDVTEDGAETIAEAFVRIKNNEAVSDDVKELVRIYVERWRK